MAVRQDVRQDLLAAGQSPYSRFGWGDRGSISNGSLPARRLVGADRYRHRCGVLERAVLGR